MVDKPIFRGDYEIQLEAAWDRLMANSPAARAMYAEAINSGAVNILIGDWSLFPGPEPDFLIYGGATLSWDNGGHMYFDMENTFYFPQDTGNDIADRAFLSTEGGEYRAISIEELIAHELYHLARDRNEEYTQEMENHANEFGNTVASELGLTKRMEADGTWSLMKKAEGEKVPSFSEVQGRNTYCFAAGTLINLADGSFAQIEQIRPGQEILAFDSSLLYGRGRLLPRRVVRTFVREDQTVIDFHGVKVTPGHLFLSGDGSFKRLDVILAEDGTVVRGHDGVEIRARTNIPIASEEDRVIPVAIETPHSEHELLYVRAGIPYGRRDVGGPIYTLLTKMVHYGYRLREDGLFENGLGDVRMAGWERSDPRLDEVARAYVVGADAISGLPLAAGHA